MLRNMAHLAGVDVVVNKLFWCILYCITFSPQSCGLPLTISPLSTWMGMVPCRMLLLDLEEARCTVHLTEFGISLSSSLLECSEHLSSSFRPRRSKNKVQNHQPSTWRTTKRLLVVIWLGHIGQSDDVFGKYCWGLLSLIRPLLVAC